MMNGEYGRVPMRFSWARLLLLAFVLVLVCLLVWELVLTYRNLNVPAALSSQTASASNDIYTMSAITPTTEKGQINPDQLGSNIESVLATSARDTNSSISDKPRISKRFLVVSALIFLAVLLLSLAGYKFWPEVRKRLNRGSRLEIQDGVGAAAEFDAVYEINDLKRTCRELYISVKTLKKQLEEPKSSSTSTRIGTTGSHREMDEFWQNPVHVGRFPQENPEDQFKKLDDRIKRLETATKDPNLALFAKTPTRLDEVEKKVTQLVDVLVKHVESYQRDFQDTRNILNTHIQTYNTGLINKTLERIRQSKRKLKELIDPLTQEDRSYVEQVINLESIVEKVNNLSHHDELSDFRRDLAEFRSSFQHGDRAAFKNASDAIIAYGSLEDYERIVIKAGANGKIDPAQLGEIESSCLDISRRFSVAGVPFPARPSDVWSKIEEHFLSTLDSFYVAFYQQRLPSLYGMKMGGWLEAINIRPIQITPGSSTFEELLHKSAGNVPGPANSRSGTIVNVLKPGFERIPDGDLIRRAVVETFT
jgi:hypothetical protein